MLLNKAILGLAKLAPDDESRYTLGAILVEQDSSTVTNGHYLVNVASGELAHSESSWPVVENLQHAEKLADKGFLVSKLAALSALKAIKAMGKRCMPILGHAAITTDDKLAVNSLESVQQFNAKVDGNFPDWRRVIPTGEPTAQVAVSAEYLEKLAAYVREHGKEGCAPIRLTLYGKGNAMRFDAQTADGQFVTALLMPLRMDTCTFAERPDQARAREENDKPAKQTLELQELEKQIAA